MSDVALGDHALLSDCGAAALVTAAGSVDWLCLPRFDSPSLLGRLLDDAAGHFLIAPVDATSSGWSARWRYRHPGLVLETTWSGPTGELVVVDAMALGRHERGHELGLTAPGVLLRQVTCTRGSVDGGLEDRPRRVADSILTHGRNDEVGSYTQSYGSATLDASVLLMAVVGFLPPADPRLLATIDAIEHGLADERGLLYRYRGGDGFAAPEGTFLLCTFWLAQALAVTGQVRRGRETLLRAAGFATELGLFAEQVDTDTGELLGNFPQAFSHLGLVVAAQALAHADHDAQDKAAAPAG